MDEINSISSRKNKKFLIFRIFFFDKFLAQAFSFESAANKDKFWFGKKWVNKELSFFGDLFTYTIACDLNGFNNLETWQIVPYVVPAKLRTFYLFDTDTQFYTNYVSAKKQPLVYRGTNANTEASDPAFSGGLLSLGAGKQLNQGAVDFDFSVSPLNVTTSMMKVKLNTLPAASTFGDLMTILTDKTIRIQVGSDGGFRLQSSQTIYESKAIKMQTGVWYWMKVIFVRGARYDLYFDCSVSVEVLGLGEEGSTFSCKSFRISVKKVCLLT